ADIFVAQLIRSELARQHVEVVLRVVARARHRAHIDHHRRFADAQQIDELGDRAGRVADGADGQRAHDPCDRKWNRVTIMPMARPNAAIIVPTRRRAYTRGSPSSGGVAWAFGGFATSTIPPIRRSTAATSTRIKYTVFSIPEATIIRRGAGAIPRARIFVCPTRAGSGKERRCPRPDTRRNRRVCA